MNALVSSAPVGRRHRERGGQVHPAVCPRCYKAPAHGAGPCAACAIDLWERECAAPDEECPNPEPPWWAFEEIERGAHLVEVPT